MAHTGDTAAGEGIWPSWQGTAPGSPLKHHSSTSSPRRLPPPGPARTGASHGHPELDRTRSEGLSFVALAASPGLKTASEGDGQWPHEAPHPAPLQPRRQPPRRPPAQPSPAASHQVWGIATPPLPRTFSFIKLLAPLVAGPQQGADGAR